MYQIDFQKPEWIHFIGIGGISMSGLAMVLLQRGFKVTGSDASKSALTDTLEKMGAKIYIGQKASNVEEGIDCVVYTAAIHEDNPEFARCSELGLSMLTRAELLGELMKNYEIPIAVAGTHGKTTTTSMLSEVLLAMDADPTLSVGGMLKSIGGNIRVGNSDIFVTEACEYTNSYLSFFPKVSIVLNVDADHLDFFHDLEHIRASFKEFMQLLPEDGLLLACGQIPELSQLTGDLSCRVLTFGLAGESEDTDITASDITFDDKGHPTFTACVKKQALQKLLTVEGCRMDAKMAEADLSFPVSLGVVGKHNVCNSLSVIGASLLLGGDIETIQKALSGFTGTDRRFEYKGTIGGVTIIDDYAHHPTEIRATLTAAAKYPHKTLRVIFQPHTYTRTKALLHDFAQALSLADEVILADIYAARETDTLGISSRTLQADLERLGAPCQYFPTFDEIESYCLKKCESGDLLITMGAGDVYKIGESLLGQ
ncbi:MAG: UDP-N-acetylmuramate--L-alanine ligase [Lachnospiraceae bacterium]|nr:UDP-N-acetylmuramate--L-alanine ligase [Lachnospiraceae bacterium]